MVQRPLRLSTRKVIAKFGRALNKTLAVFAKQPERIEMYVFVAKDSGVHVLVVERVLTDHTGVWPVEVIRFGPSLRRTCISRSATRRKGSKKF